MFLHIGEGEMVPVEEIVMIGNLESTASGITSEFLDISRQEGFVIDRIDGEPRSFILTGEKIYLSIISSSTLAGRLEEVRDYSDY